MEAGAKQSAKHTIPTASAILDDGTIVEVVFQRERRQTAFAIYDTGRWTLQDSITLGPNLRLVPFSPNNNLIKNEVVLLPAEPQIYGNEESLVDTSKLRNAVAIADGGRGGEVRYLGKIDNTGAATAKLVRKLAAKYERLTFCYEAGADRIWTAPVDHEPRP